MATKKKIDSETVAQELYKKNLDLFNANRQLELSSKLYNTMNSTLNLKGVTHEFIKEITNGMSFDSGIVVLKTKKGKSLQIKAATTSTINTFVEKNTHKKLTSLIFPLNNESNSLVNSFINGRRQITKHPEKIWGPNLGEEDFSIKLTKNRNYSTLVQPIIFGNSTLGVFALSANREIKLGMFEKNLLKQISTLFGIALNRVTLYQDLRKANVELRKLDKIKDEFVYIATHELKTPVTVMKGYLSMILNGSFGKVPKAYLEPLNEITLANQQLILLVNDLLDIARSENKQLNLKTERVNLAKVVRETIKNVEALATQKGLSMKYHDEGDLLVMADEDRLREVCNNLLSNAIKYSEKGVIEVSHTTEKTMIITHVKDHGHGVSEKDQKKLFTRFFRAEEMANKAPGTGLGLFIVKQLVEKLGGRIWFTSKIGVGTTFSFSLMKADSTEK